MIEQLCLENCKDLQEIKEQSWLIDYWIDEIQESAMNEVPIIILFCT